MKAVFLYPDSPISPHKSLEAWAMSVCKAKIKTPKGVGFFNNIDKLPKPNILLLESLYCLPFAKKYKKKHGCKIISMVVDTSFWSKKLSLSRRLYYKLYLDSVDAFITLSDRSKKDMINFGIKKPVVVIRPFLANKFEINKRSFSNNILFIGNEPEEKGYKYLIEAMQYLPEFSLYLIGNCCKKIPEHQPENIHVLGRVQSLKKYFEICAYYCHPADFEPFGVAPLEAMYAGLVPVLTKEVGLTEIFTQPLQRLLLENNNPKTIARKIHQISLLGSKEKHEIIKECKSLAKNYTKDKNIKEFKTEFWKLAEMI